MRYPGPVLLCAYCLVRLARTIGLWPARPAGMPPTGTPLHLSALPACSPCPRQVPACAAFAAVAALHQLSCRCLARAARATGRWSYDGMLAAELGKWAAAVLQAAWAIDSFGEPRAGWPAAILGWATRPPVLRSTGCVGCTHALLLSVALEAQPDWPCACYSVNWRRHAGSGPGCLR